MPHNSNATAKITRVIVTSVIISYFILNFFLNSNFSNFFFEWNRKLWMFSLALNNTELREIVVNALFALLE